MQLHPFILIVGVASLYWIAHSISESVGVSFGLFLLHLLT